MKNLMKVLILPSLFIICTTAQAKNSSNAKATKKEGVVMKAKNQAHQCAIYKKNAKKARQLYSVNKKKVNRLNIQLKVLAKDQKRMPSSVKMAKKVVDHQITKLKFAKKKRLDRSLKYLEKHIQYTKAFKRSCAQNPVKPRKRKFKDQDIGKFLSIASM